MDKTITRKATFGPFLLFATQTLHPARLVLFPLFGCVAIGLWLLGKLDLLQSDYRKVIKTAGLRIMLGRKIKAEDADRVGRAFADHIVAEKCHAQALEQIERDRAEGYRVVLASASNQLYVRAIADRLGFDAAICTRNRLSRDGAVLPAIPGRNCYAHAKLEMVRDWMSARKIDRKASHIRFYSDHVSDAPCLGWADEAFATNPHPPLRKLATRKEWTVLDWT